MDILNKNILVLGFATTGEAVAKFAHKKGAKVFVYDENVETKEYTKVYDALTINFDFCVISPGFSSEHAVVKQLISRGVTIISEIEFASRFIKGKIIAVTGTNGKTTTVSLLGEIFKSAKKEVYVCGNVGVALVNYADIASKNSYLICEVSSFQLEYIDKFCPYISAILNITPDHLIRHKTFENYENLKHTIYSNQKESFVVLNKSILPRNKYINPIYFSVEEKSNCFVKNNLIYFNNKKITETKHISLLGTKNLENVLACVSIAKLIGIKNSKIKKGIKNFMPLANRLQPVGIKKNIVFINDSKATNIDSTLCALECFKKPILLLGGSDKGYEYDEVVAQTNIKYIVAFGDVKNKIIMSAKRLNKNVFQAENLKQATYLAYSLAESGDIVLLSPASASYDEFYSYEHRGEMFKKYVEEICK